MYSSQTIEVTQRSQQITNRLEQAAQGVSKPFNATEQNLVNGYFDYLLHNTTPQKSSGSLTQRMQDLVNAFEPLCELAPFTASEKNIIQQYADYFGYIYQPAAATPKKQPTDTATTIKIANYKPFIIAAIITVAAIAVFFVFRKKR